MSPDEVFLRACQFCESAPREIPRAGRAGLRFRAQSGFKRGRGERSCRNLPGSCG